ncbi:MAG: cache domain-containing protein [Candidatus Hodarchaeales archaeon]|jgi:HAMP domain-containing protein
MLEKFNIKTQILGSFVVFATIILLVISSLSIVNIFLVGNNTQRLATEAMDDQIKRNMLLKSFETAQIIQRKFQTAEAVVHSIAAAAEQLFSPTIDVFNDQASYLDLNVSNMPQVGYDNIYKTNISLFASTYYAPGTSLDDLSTLTVEMNETISQSTHLDPLFKSFFSDYSEFVWFKVCFKNGEILRKYPGSVINTARTYDPSEEHWYLKAIIATRGTVISTDPYIDPVVNEWVVTVAKTFFDDDGSELGVVAADLYLQSIQDEVNAIHFLDTGYSALVLKNGLTIAHPDWIESMTELISIQELEVNEDNSPALNDSILLSILSNEEGIVKFVKDGEFYLVSHSPISTTFVLLIFVLEAEAVDTVVEIEETIRNAQSQVTTITFILSLVTFAGVLAVGLWLATKISNPIVNLSESALKIVSNVTERDFLQKVDFDDSGAQDDEIGQLSKSFSHMIDSMKDQYLKFCRKCGTKYEELDDFCKKCGEHRPIS